MNLSHETIREVVAQALREDIGHGDITTQATIPADLRATAQVLMREAGVVAGLPVLAAVFAALDETVVVVPCAADGEQVGAGAIIAQIEGSARAILTGERVALNLLQRLCGIATMTARYVDAVAGLPVRLLDTRKTTPGLRALEKYAVRMGGATNHRFGLYDGVMLKDNHLALLAAQGAGLEEAVRRARAAVGPMVCVEVEVETVEQAQRAAKSGADMILLDNMAPEELRAAVAAIGGRARTEASGGITLGTLRAVAETGVDYISSGALTHSARALDISLEIQV
jgi:nicotinate-nucleotide pyrophosphorylase (carboxylating)